MALSKRENPDLAATLQHRIRPGNILGLVVAPFHQNIGQQPLDDALRCFADPSELDLVYDISLKTLNLKSQILAVDPFEAGVGRVLQFGHLHAHALERALDFEIPHGQAVLWGVCLDLELSKTKIVSMPPDGRSGSSNGSSSALSDTALEVVFRRLQRAGSFDKDFFAKVDAVQLGEFYIGDAKSFHHDPESSGYRVLKLEEVGQYANVNRFQDQDVIGEQIVTHDLPDILSAVSRLQSRIGRDIGLIS